MNKELLETMIFNARLNGDIKEMIRINRIAEFNKIKMSDR